MIDAKRGIMAVLCDAINPYRWVTAARNLLFDLNVIKSQEYSLPTICVGNITVGGTGKTPHTEYLIRLLQRNFRTAVLSRGYGRRSKGYIKGTPSTTAEILGDEPFQMVNKFPGTVVAVCEKRATGIEHLLAEQEKPQIILLDDAYQHRHVKAGLNILLIDSNRPIWQDCVLPFGRMRESLAGIKRANIVIITKCNEITARQKEWCRNYIKSKKNVPVFFSSMKYRAHYPLFKETAPLNDLAACDEVLLLTGIAKPEPLKKEIQKRGVKVETMHFGDHHNFTTADIEKISTRFNNIKSDKKAIITTEKDATRLIQRSDLPLSIKKSIYALPIEVEILDGEDKMFNQIIENYVTENSRNS